MVVLIKRWSIAKVMKRTPLGNMYTCIKCNGNPSKSWWDIWVWTKVLDRWTEVKWPASFTRTGWRVKTLGCWLIELLILKSIQVKIKEAVIRRPLIQKSFGDHCPTFTDLGAESTVGPLEHTQTPSTEGLREGRGGSDGIKSRNPFLQAAASAEETLEDRDTEIWAHGSGMEDVWRCSQHSLLPAPSPPTHSPTLIELFVSPPVIVAKELRTKFVQAGKALRAFPLAGAPTACATKWSWRAAERWRKGGRGGLAEP